MEWVNTAIRMLNVSENKEKHKEYMKVYRKLHNEEINRRRRELYNEKKRS